MPGEMQSNASACADWVRSKLFLNLNAGMEEKVRAIVVCATMAIAYVALLYAPALFLPSPRSMREHMLRRFACAAVASALAPFVCLTLLPVHPHWDWGGSSVLELFGLRTHHLAIILPTLLTTMLYLGPLVLACFGLIEWCWAASQRASGLVQEIVSVVVNYGQNMLSDVLVWRNCFVAPVSEELVFRACMVPLLLCGGFSTSAAVFLCPLFFAIAHLHHFWELIYRQKHGKSTAALIVGMQFGYTTVFGWYATFLYLRTGHLIAPIVAHIFCNTMGLPDIDEALTSSHRKVIGVAYVVGVVGFLTLLWPTSDPGLFNKVSLTGDCDCWSGFCKWTARQKLENLMGSEES